MEERELSIPRPLRAGNRALVAVQERLNRIFTPLLNPMYYLGALGYLFFWVLLATGLYLYSFYEMSVTGAYGSVQRLTEEQRFLGGVIRSLHRYASDALVIVVVLHALQTFFSDRFRRYRWLAWVSGVVLFPALWLEGVTGYVMVFDDRGAMAAVRFAEWLDAWPLAVEPFSRYFIPHGPLTSLFFFILTYLHITLTVGMVIVLWIHCMRISRPVITPPRWLGWVVGLLLLVVSIAKPAVSGPPADLTRLIAAPDMDWFYLFPFPLADHFSIGVPIMWALSLGGLFLLTLLPWLIRDPWAAPLPATVSLEHCTGCEACQKACPFEAINIKPRSDGRPYPWEVEIIPERCAACGLCLPACPFPALAVGKWTHHYFEERLTELFPPGATGKTMLFVCERSAAVGLKGLEGFAVMTIPCLGILGARVVNFALARGARGVVVAACVTEDCHFRVSQRKLDITRTEIGGMKGVAIIEAEWFDPEEAREAFHKARESFLKGEI